MSATAYDVIGDIHGHLDPLESQPGERVNYSLLMGHALIAALCLRAALCPPVTIRCSPGLHATGAPAQRTTRPARRRRTATDGTPRSARAPGAGSVPTAPVPPLPARRTPRSDPRPRRLRRRARAGAPPRAPSTRWPAARCHEDRCGARARAPAAARADRKSTRLNSSHVALSRMPSSA